MAAKENLQRKADYVAAVTRGKGFVPWQGREKVSPQEKAFRDQIERRKDRMLAGRLRVNHPVLLTEKEIEQARRNIRKAPWAREWFEGQREIADYVTRQPDGYAEAMISEVTPWIGYSFICPNCYGVKSFSGVEYTTIGWDYRNPDVIRCTCCGQTHPSEAYPETARLVCPRVEQTLTFYQNDEERQHPEDRSGKYAYVYSRTPVGVCFSGIVRERRVTFMINSARSLALMYRMTEDPRYAEGVVGILARLAYCFRNTWLYHDWRNTVADCDPLYAAWHDQTLPLEFKRNLFTYTYEKDEMDRAGMQVGYWGAGRFLTSTGGIGSLSGLCLSYDLVYDARGGDGKPLWTAELRERIEKDLFLEWVMEAEPFSGGRGKAKTVNNKAPRVYNAMAATARCLGITELADTAIRGYEAIRNTSFGFDGFSHETPSYNSMYLDQLLYVPETLHGFRWPKGFTKRQGKVNLYKTDPRLRLMLYATLDQLRPDGRLLPLGDSHESDVKQAGGSHILEIGLKRYPKYFEERLPAMYRYRRTKPSEYAVLRLDAGDFDLKRKADPEEGLNLPDVFFPRWMTAILRHGEGMKGTVLSITFNPPGGHRHYDNLALYYVDRGQTMLGDHGYLAEAPMQQWVKSTFSHNLVVVDDQQQLFRTGRPRRPELRMMVTSPKVSVVEAASRVYEQCRDFRRLVALIKGPGAETFAVDIFRVKGGKKHDYRIFTELASSDAGEDGRLEFTGLGMPPESPLPQVGASQREEDIFGLRDVRQVKNPPAGWQATWKEKGRSHRMWMLSEVDVAQASNGPGQERFGDVRQAGRRLRYVDAVNMGKDLASAFVAVHEPGGPRGSMPVKQAVRLDVAEKAGPDAVALRVESRWGTYLVFSEFRREAEVEGVRFKGKFGVLCRTPEGGRWLLTCGANTFRADGFGFEDAPANWSGRVVSQTERELITDADRPARWTSLPEGVTSYVLVKVGKYTTGFPVHSVKRNRIAAGRFPLPAVTRFDLPAVQVL